MKAISIAAYRRPEYLRKTLNALTKAEGVDEYEVFVSIDKGGNVARLARRYQDRLKLTVLEQTEHQGVNQNTYNAPALAMDAGADSVVVVEEDVVLSPDALRMAEWYTAQTLSDTELCLNLFNWTPDPARIYELTSADFTPWGFVVTRGQWQRYVGRYWRDDRFRKKRFPASEGWDWNLQAARVELGLSTTAPFLNRAKHIGRKGFYGSVAHWNQHHRDKPLANVAPGDYVRIDAPHS